MQSEKSSLLDMNKLAIMQPYLFPYIGYYQLLNAVDLFVVYDDVNFIKKGWINRNNILVNNKSMLFTLPLLEASQNKKIKDVFVNDVIFDSWREKFLRTMIQNYSKAPYVKEVTELVSCVLEKKINQSVADIARRSLLLVSEYVKIDTKIIPSSSIYENDNLSGQERIIDICKAEKADVYINPIGGKDLYNNIYFEKNNIKIYFIESDFTPYKQSKNQFVPGLSIIDVLMNNSIEQIGYLLKNYKLI